MAFSNLINKIATSLLLSQNLLAKNKFEMSNVKRLRA